MEKVPIFEGYRIDPPVIIWHRIGISVIDDPEVSYIRTSRLRWFITLII